MKGFLSNHKKLVAVTAFFALSVALAEAWSATAHVRGRAAARYDVSHGHLKILVYGLPPAWRPEYARLLKEKYGVETDTVASCIVSEALLSYARGYNEVSVAATSREFGHDIFEEAAKEAVSNWERRRAQSPAKE